MYKTNSIYASVIPEGAWTLSDSFGEAQLEPCAAFKHSKAHIVHTSSPASSRWKEWVKQLGAIRYIMDVWSLEELQVLLYVG
jgi:response regulator RpfG family c-di-GMP phosphodiesterase